MINFIIEDNDLKKIINKIMMNYNYKYNIQNYSKEINTTNIYILDYDPNRILNLSKLKNIRYNLNDWSSIIILVTKNNKIKNDLFNKKYLILDIININNIERRLKEDINLIINHIFQNFNNLNYNYKNIYYSIPFQDIYYIENDSTNKRCLIKTKDDEFYIPGTLTSILSKLDKRFIKCSRSYLINLEKVKHYSIKDNVIYFDKNIKIYEISRSKKQEIINYLRNTNC